MDEINDDPDFIAFRDKALTGIRAAVRRAAEGADLACEICGGDAEQADVLLASGDIQHVCLTCLLSRAPPTADPDEYSIEDDDGVRTFGIPDDLF